MRALDVVAEGEEGVGAEGDAADLFEPGALFLLGEDGRLLGEDALPVIRLEEVAPLAADVDVDGVVAVRAAHIILEREAEDLRALAQEPAVRLVAREARAVDAALLAGADADGLAVVGVADGVALRVLERDGRDEEVALRGFRQVMVLRHDVVENVFVNLDIVAALLEHHAEDLFRLDGSGLVGGIHLEDDVVALFLRLEDLERLRLVARRDDAVADLVLEDFRRRDVADITERGEVAVGAHAVGAARAHVGRRERREREVRREVHLAQRFAERRGDGGARRAHVLERGRGGEARRLLEFAHELPTVHGVEEVDVAGTAVLDRERQVAALHVDLGWLLVRIAAVLEFEFFHIHAPFV